jgi:hypothetical protein
VNAARGPALLICAAINGLYLTEALPDKVASFTFSSTYIGSETIGLLSTDTRFCKLYIAVALR